MFSSYRVSVVAKLHWRSCSQSIRSATCCFTAPTHSTGSNWITESLQVFYHITFFIPYHFNFTPSCFYLLWNCIASFFVIAITAIMVNHWVFVFMIITIIMFTPFLKGIHSLLNYQIIKIRSNYSISAYISAEINHKFSCTFSVSTGILSQRMFVMLPCGGVGVRENFQTEVDNSPKALHEIDQKPSLLLMKSNIISKRRQGTQEKMTTKTGY